MQIKDIYLVHVDGYIGAYKHGRYPMMSYAPQNEFINFVESLRDDFPEYRLHCVINKGIEDKIRQRIKIDNEQDKFMQNQVKFKPKVGMER